MTDTRREFIRKAMLLGGAAGMAALPASIQKAFAINPETGSSFFDAEHIVLLMQENRSFDHAYGALQGVRGFNDPRAFRLPNGNKVWLQANAKSETYAPFRLDIKDTKITWMGSLPHGRDSQVAAWNNGRHDNWLEAKKPGEAYADMPLTLGYYTREDIPFYYALADAFTVCDQNFCSSLTGTDPNRLHFWSGNIRAKHDAAERAYTFNGDVEAGVSWRTFPELLEENNIAWKVYQNEVSIDVGFTEEEDRWLGNFGDNVLEYFTQYNLKFLKGYVDYLPEKITLLQEAINTLQTKLNQLAAGSDEYITTEKKLTQTKQWLQDAKDDQQVYTAAAFDKLSPKQQNIHKKAFAVNDGDPHQHELTPLTYTDGTVKREINIPKGDVLYQFRKDVESGNLPTVSWLVAPENFSDHPDAAWFGSWYLSETLDILTKNPEVWKKTIFILAYDENDGYYDHVPPFVAPEFNKPQTGLASKGIDTSLDHVTMKDDVPGPIGLGYRVPLVIASPWSRGGYVNSQVFDHTSILQFMEVFLNKKTGKNIKETNITPWRRAICGDLTSAFRPYNGEKMQPLPFLEKDPFIQSIHKAKFKNVPSGYKSLTADEIALINKQPGESPYMPQQEKGVRAANALPYDLNVDGALSMDKNFFSISMGVSDALLGDKTAGCPFTIYTYGKDFKVRNYAVAAGDTLSDTIGLTDFENGKYDIALHGPNGFYRAFTGDKKDALVLTEFSYEDANAHVKGKRPVYTGKVVMRFVNPDTNNQYKIRITDNAYKLHPPIIKNIPAGNESRTPVEIVLDTKWGWYDFSVFVEGYTVFEKRYAGHVETGAASKTDPLMGGI